MMSRDVTSISLRFTYKVGLENLPVFVCVFSYGFFRMGVFALGGNFLKNCFCGGKGLLVARRFFFLPLYVSH